MLKKPIDRITEAYEGNMGEDFSKKTRNRVNWIVNQVNGEKILDIGCSQGIIPIILGREGKLVDAIDIAQESIDYATEQLAQEHSSVQSNINFKVSNFMTDYEIDDNYENILLTEVLEHISDPESFLKKIYDHLTPDGRLIVTVPFGVNDYFDHKRTYYFTTLHSHLSTFFHLEEFTFLGKWTGVVCKKREERVENTRDVTFDIETISRLEDSFEDVERDLLDRVKNLQQQLKTKNDHLKNVENKLRSEINQLKDRISQINNQKEDLNKEIQELVSSLNDKDIQLHEVKKDNERALKEKELHIQNLNDETHKLKEIIENKKHAYEKEKEINRGLFHQNENKVNELTSKIFDLQKEYRELSNSLSEKISNKDKEINTLNLTLVKYESREDRKRNKIKLLEYQIKELNKELINREKELGLEKDKVADLNHSNTQRNSEKEDLYEFIEELKDQIAQNKLNNPDVQVKHNSNIDRLNDQIVQLKNDLSSSLHNEEKALKEVMTVTRNLEEKETRLKEKEQLLQEKETKLNIIERKYLALKSSKLGRMTLNYWQWRKNLGKKAKRSNK
ncbi:methyltransferase domain-containing protein [Halobacillus yeomjeoni]|uniref:Methyltransferase domain-containing protein n=1 Tax=Halobacillus yeomjeoni TaxID=311194 RepID=A0A931MVS7_9BACI|nr:methyltransferase domain-containing protein [Halobacillus yeomjeoni]MBH0230731.1 methyltransferase domain-containing protein [Halobacillus yeomjeoni]